MDEVATKIQRVIEHHIPPLWAVVLAALVLAWLNRAGNSRRMASYDTWWLFNLRRSELKSLRRRRRS